MLLIFIIRTLLLNKHLYKKYLRLFQKDQIHRVISWKEVNFSVEKIPALFIDIMQLYISCLLLTKVKVNSAYWTSFK